jgi:hypothetical protein
MNNLEQDLKSGGKNLSKWNSENRAIAVDGKSSSWSRECIGMPSVIPVGKRLDLLYDA